MIDINDNEIEKGLVTLAIKDTLLGIGSVQYDKVVGMLENKYNCYLSDCYEHPEYLKQILEELFGNSYNVIIDSIQQKLANFKSKQSVHKFLQVIGG